eukprot:10421889-Alexandrium_andersonii.AAC.1
MVGLNGRTGRRPLPAYRIEVPSSKPSFGLCCKEAFGLLKQLRLLSLEPGTSAQGAGSQLPGCGTCSGCVQVLRPKGKTSSAPWAGSIPRVCRLALPIMGFCQLALPTLVSSPGLLSGPALTGTMRH